jgi:UDP-N-acetylmuramoyl-L-alanyl-D-glutamate--2,6-diaminopimelate ligase
VTARALNSFLAGAGVTPLTAVPAGIVVQGVGIDSRSVKPGDLFFALRGAKDDGARHARHAAENGAVAVIADSPKPDQGPGVPWVRVAEARLAMGLCAREWFGRPDEAMTLVGITGTKGKTTVAFLVESIATAAGRSAGRIGTVGYAFGGRETPAARTTPEATELYELLASMREARTEIVAMEVSSHALALHRVAGARFPVAAFLNLGRDHLEFHGSSDAYFEAKAALFDRLGSSDTAILPSDDPHGLVLAARTPARVIVFGHGRDAHVRIEEERSGLGGSFARMTTPRGRVDIHTSLRGSFNVLNAAAAAACGIALDFDCAAIAAGIEGLKRVPGRLESVSAGQPFAVFVDYAHTEESLAAVLDAVRELTSGKLLVVFGCGGDRDRGKRFAMGRAAALRADRLVVTSDNPRREDPLAILRDIEAGVVSVSGAAERSSYCPDRADALKLALGEARSGDAVVIAGKGHEKTQVFDGRVEPFDDRDVARRELAALGFIGGSHADA